MNENLLAIRNALNLVGHKNNNDIAVNVVPTFKTRSALDFLVNSSTQQMIEDETNLREITENLFNWSGKQRANKTLLKALSTALNTEGKYHHAVELTAYISALSPILEPDRLARLFLAVNDVNNAYAPARYTLQLSHKLTKIFHSFNDDRKEKLAYSLWVEAHTGRWWDLTAGQGADGNVENVVIPEVNIVTNSELIELFTSFSLPYSEQAVTQLSKLKPNIEIKDALTKYNDFLLKGKFVDPDVALLASYIPWLEIEERPESPIGSLVDNLLLLHNELEYDFPDKPKTFSALFPNVSFYGGANFPFPNSLLVNDGKVLTGKVSLELVKTATALADNRTYMGNCTWSYKGRMETGDYALFRIINGGEIYNGSITLHNNKWTLAEINSRFNRGNVPTNIRNAFTTFISTLPLRVIDNESVKQLEIYKRMASMKQKKYRYTL